MTDSNRKKSRFNKNDEAIMKITRYGFLKGELVIIVDPYKDNDDAVLVTNGRKTHRVPTKYLD